MYPKRRDIPVKIRAQFCLIVNMSLDQVLANCASPDPNVRSAAEAQLNQTIASNPRQYIADLASVLSIEGVTSYSRIGAALALKNALQNTT